MKRALSSVLLATLMLSAASALGGARLKSEVRVNNYADGSGHGSGSLGAARNSADTVQHIGCQRRKGDILCSATDKSGKSVLCSSTDPAIVAVVSTITDSSFIDFSVKANGTCAFVNVYSDSYEPPKQP